MFYKLMWVYLTGRIVAVYDPVSGEISLKLG